MTGANPALDAAKSKVAEAVDRLSGELEALSLQIHGNPELCFKEEKASACECGKLVVGLAIDCRLIRLLCCRLVFTFPPPGVWLISCLIST